MDRCILHIDFNSYFATIEQQANPRLRDKPIGVTGGDRLERTVLGAASVEAKKLGIKTGMSLQETKRVCPNLILVRGDSDKYLSTTKRFLNILKDYSPILEVFSIDEAFLELRPADQPQVIKIAEEIKQRIRSEIGEWVRCSIGISYNKMLSKLAGSLYKPDGLVLIADSEAARFILDRVKLDEVCGIGPGIKKRLNNLGVFDFKTLRQIPKQHLLASFKSYGEVLYRFARGEDYNPVVPFFKKEEIKSAGHRHTFYKDTADTEQIKQVLLKISELIARRLRAKNLTGKTISFWYRSADFSGNGKQATINSTDNGLELFNAAWKIFWQIWDRKKIRMVGASVTNLRSNKPSNLSFLPEEQHRQVISAVLDKINDRYGEFTLQRAVLLGSGNVRRKPNPYLSDYRFRI